MSDVARPGDVLLVPISNVRKLTTKALEDMEWAIKMMCPGVRAVMFVPGSGNITVFRPAESAY